MKGRGFGIILLLMVMAVVMYLVAQNWEAFGPAAVKVKDHKSRPIVDAHGETEAAEEVRSRNLPDLEDMDREVQKHNAEASETYQALDALKESK